MWTSECTSDPTQSSFLAHTQLGTVKYHRCTLSEAKEYERDGHRILEEATGRLWRPFLTTISTYGSTQDPDAFYNQVEEVKKAERALGEAGQSASHDDSLTADASEDYQAADKKSEVASSESASVSSDGVCVKPEMT